MKKIKEKLSVLLNIFEKIKEKIKNIKCKNSKKIERITNILNKYSLIWHIVLSLFLMLFIESFSRHSLIKGLYFAYNSPLVFLYNAFLIFMTLSIVYLFKRRAFIRLGISAIWVYLGYMNGTVLSNRVTPFTAQDIKLVEDMMDILDKYMSPDKLFSNVLLVVAALLILYLFWKKGPLYKEKINYIRNLIGILFIIFLFTISSKLALENHIISSYFGNIAFAYEDYGFPYCFSCTLFGTGIGKPYNYSEDVIMSIAKDDDTQVPNITPNIIFVQLESFFDVLNVNYLKCSEDPIPYFRELMEKYSSGYFTVPSVGAGTANTEFETISGMSMRYFGPGEYPYKTILKKTTCDSIPYALSDIGYSTHAIHNNKSTFYSRVDVFPNLGFDTFTSKEYMNNFEETLNGWVKDDILIKCILDCLKSTEEQDYIYTISVQGHGSYPKEKLIENPKITVSGSQTEEKDNQWEYYVNMINEMDMFVKNLIDAVDSTGEESVIVFYGDHIPTMDLTEGQLTNGNLFQTNYVIWDNIGLSEMDQDLAAYQIGAEVLKQLDIHNGITVQCHQNKKNELDYQYFLEMIQYDILYGKEYLYKNNGKRIAKNMSMGIIDQKIEKVVQIVDNIYIFGENFTQQTKIHINDEFYSTRYVNENLIILKDKYLKDGDKVSIKQLAPNKRLLSEEDSTVYYIPIPVDYELEVLDVENDKEKEFNINELTKDAEKYQKNKDNIEENVNR